MKKALQVFLNENLEKPLEDILPKRYSLISRLGRNNLVSLAQLLGKTEKDLRGLKDIGPVLCAMIKESLADLGLSIKEDFIPETKDVDKRKRELPDVSVEDLEGMEEIMGHNFALFKEYYEAEEGEQKIEAKNRIVMQNRGLVKRALELFASKIREGFKRDSSLELQDITHQAFLGLIAAVDHFDPKKKFAFSTYAYWWIKQAIFRMVDGCGTVRLPSYRYDEVRCFQAEVMELEKEKGDSNISSAEIAEALGMPEEEVEKLMVDAYIAFGGDLELDTHIQHSSKKSVVTLHEITDLGDIFEPPDAEAEEGDIREKIDAMLECLKPKKRRCLELRFGLVDGVPRTLEEVGEIVGVSRERVRQIEVECLKRLRKTKHWEVFKDYFDLPDPREHSESSKRKRHFVRA